MRRITIRTHGGSGTGDRNNANGISLHLKTMPGIDAITAVNFSSAGKGKAMCPKQGNRRLQSIFYFMAIQMLQVSTNGMPGNRIFREYYLK